MMSLKVLFPPLIQTGQQQLIKEPVAFKAAEAKVASGASEIHEGRAKINKEIIVLLVIAEIKTFTSGDGDVLQMLKVFCVT